MSPSTIDQLPGACPLIGRDDPPPFVVLHEHGAAPALVVCDHASRAFPRGMQRLGLPELPSWQHIAWDIGGGRAGPRDSRTARCARRAGRLFAADRGLQPPARRPGGLPRARATAGSSRATSR
ncbi:MAG: hypothetical protein MZV65_53655 [Chromatiales bacterium]|nr:hypothetical protein [Chromatiales bacterium]